MNTTSVTEELSVILQLSKELRELCKPVVYDDCVTASATDLAATVEFSELRAQLETLRNEVASLQLHLDEQNVCIAKLSQDNQSLQNYLEEQQDQDAYVISLEARLKKQNSQDSYITELKARLKKRDFIIDHMRAKVKSLTRAKCNLKASIRGGGSSNIMVVGRRSNWNE